MAGRPPRGDAPATSSLTLRLTDDERAELEKLRFEGETLGAACRRTLLAAVAAGDSGAAAELRQTKIDLATHVRDIRELLDSLEHVVDLRDTPQKAKARR